MELPNPYHLFEKKKSKPIENMENQKNTEKIEKNESFEYHLTVLWDNLTWLSILLLFITMLTYINYMSNNYLF